MSLLLPPPATLYHALAERDPAFEGIFFAGVRTTGIFCRPTCTAKKPRPENVEFFATASSALHAGYRPCLRCRPLDAATPEPPLVSMLREAVDRAPARRFGERELEAMGVDPTSARRQFRHHTGMTFAAYQRARRMGLAMKEVRLGRDLLEVQLDHGYESSSGFRDAFTKMFGAPPSRARDRAALVADAIETPLGSMLAVASERGVCVLEFVERRGLERELLEVRKKFGSAIVPGKHEVLEAARTELGAYFAGRRLSFDVPLDVRGSEFQRAVWTELGRIEPGCTCSYAEIAARVGRPGASRAVGRANGSNRIAILIPCHRVIGADGALSGYGGGVWRKRWLLDHERKAGAHAGDSRDG
jgi:AraC family transcriptional regulator of adaptative response/methylated-DNA-[protein]-cysteine methyltransferase